MTETAPSPTPAEALLPLNIREVAEAWRNTWAPNGTGGTWGPSNLAPAGFDQSPEIIEFEERQRAAREQLVSASAGEIAAAGLEGRDVTSTIRSVELAVGSVFQDGMPPADVIRDIFASTVTALATPAPSQTGPTQ